MNATKQQARLGMFHLKEAVVNILFEMRKEGPIKPDIIRKHLGILRVEENPGWQNCLIRGILHHLRHEQRVDYIETEQGKGWKITDDEEVLLGGQSPEEKDAPYF